MKVIILAGGRGSRLAEETTLRPKPMVEIGGRPILWHIMSIYASADFKEFLIACGYKGEVIREYFRDYATREGDYRIHLATGEIDMVNPPTLDWNVGLIDTGVDTMTGGRVRRLRSWVGEETFMVTYGDGVGNIDIRALVDFHRAHGRLATVTAVRPPSRFGGLNLDGNLVREFSEKPQTGEGWINGGFFVFEPGVWDYLSADDDVLERAPLERIAAEGQLMAYRHLGFWQPMDTIREKLLLESLWESENPPWKTWE